MHSARLSLCNRTEHCIADQLYVLLLDVFLGDPVNLVGDPRQCRKQLVRALGQVYTDAYNAWRGERIGHLSLSSSNG